LYYDEHPKTNANYLSEGKRTNGAKSCVIGPGNAVALWVKMKQDLAFVLDFGSFHQEKEQII